IGAQKIHDLGVLFFQIFFAAEQSGVEKWNVHFEGIGEDIELQPFRFGAEGSIGDRAVDIAGLDRRNARRLVADLQYRRFLYRIDADPLEHRAHAEVRGRTEPADAKLFALELSDTFDLRTRDELIVQFVEQADEVDDIRSFKIGSDARCPASLRKIEISRNENLHVGGSTRDVNNLGREAVLRKKPAIFTDIH